MEFSRNLPKVCNFHDQNHQKYKDNFGLTEKIVIFLIFLKNEIFISFYLLLRFPLLIIIELNWSPQEQKKQIEEMDMCSQSQNSPYHQRCFNVQATFLVVP